jgi:hypothetical protein
MDIGRAGFLSDLEIFIHMSERMGFDWNFRSLCGHGAVS